MIRIGTVNIDTSHPMGFAEAMEKENRARYVGVYNDSFRGDAEVEGFIRRFGLEKRCQSIDELAEMCDIGFIQGCDWDDHLRCAMPFLERGKPVFIDKPLVGNLRDLKRVEELAAKGAVILGASSARYAYEVQEFLAIPEEERGKIVQVFGTAGVDEFNYGIHIAECIGGILGDGARWVRYLGRGEAGGKYAESYYVQYAGGESAIFNTFTGTWQAQPDGFRAVAGRVRADHAGGGGVKSAERAVRCADGSDRGRRILRRKSILGELSRGLRPDVRRTVSQRKARKGAFQWNKRCS